ncbi:MAG TPA: T9SS type A sorting domain-containing protein, partial [Flavobacteriales bacterium]|nr:T9SS type A sorting domain-containing protein [Flavobacteriales bacterium]
TETVIATIPVTGKGEFEIVNDAFTAEPTSNANFYISLGGRDLTGTIYKGLATAEEDGSVSILPNPNNGQFTFSFSVATATDVTIEVVNALGQTVFNDMLRNFEGTYRKEMDLTSMSNGVYYLKVKRNGETSTHKIVFR